MVHKFSLTILIIFFAVGALAQSGRNKPKSDETPSSKEPRRAVNLPVEPVKTKATPTPTPENTDDGEDVIRVESALVPIPVSVTDAAGRAVANLQLADFSLEIDGKAAEVSELSRADTPVRLALLFDNSTSVMLAREFEKKAAIRFFRQVIRPEKDLAALFSVASGTILEQELTKNVSLLTRAIENFGEPKGATALLDGIILAARYLKDAEGGRRVIVIVSDGDDNLSDATLEETVRVLQLNNCQVYVVKTTDFENYKRTGVRGGNANITFLSAERRMQELAKQTGGAVYSPVDEKELDAAFTRISAELAQQYILNYYPEHEKSERGAFKTISLKIKDRENLTVRARKGYFVPKR
jgi:Ca-activated chloride channel homolog